MMAAINQDELRCRAREIASGYRLVIEPARSGGFIGHALELPKVIGRAKSQEKCLADLRDNIVDAVATLLDLGRIPPRPNESRLSEQVNIRLTIEEKHRAEELAQQQGFRGLADYVRSLVAKEVRHEA